MSHNNNEAVLGIDLGTSNSVAAVYLQGDCHVIADSKGKTVQPSVVSFHPNEKVLVGPSAKKRRLVDPQNTLFSVKRLMGIQATSERAGSFTKKLPYKVTEGPKKQPVLHVRGHRLTPTQVSALILKHMKNLAKNQLGQELSKAVITVPANFNDAQRNATKAAGKLAGLEVIRIINEPTAAALAYGHGQGMATQVLLYDFGGGTFDVTLLRITGEIFEVLATAGDTQLGGDDIDERLMDAIVEDFMRTHRYDLTHNEMAMLRIRSVAEKIKCQLSETERSSVEIKELAYGPGGKALDLTFELTREKLEFLMADLVERTLEICDEAFALADLKTDDIDDVVLVGGSTRIPLVRKEVTTYFGRQPQSRINPDEVVAVGAAIQGAALTEKSIRYTGPLALLLDVTPMSLCIGTVGGFATQVIPRNSQLPTEQTRIFSTSADYQDSVSIRVCQGEHRRFDDNIYLGELTMERLRPAPRGEVRVEVTFEINTDGILQVHARDPDTNTQQTARMQTVGTPTEGDLDALMDELPHVDQKQGSPSPEENQLPAADGGDG